MKKKICLLVSVLIIATLLFTGCNSSEPTSPSNSSGQGGNNAASSNDKVYEMKISHLTSEIDPLHIGYEYLNDILTERTDGRIKVTIYGNKQLANSDREQAEMVQAGLAELGTTPAFTLGAMSADLNEWFIYDYPYMFPTEEILYDFTDSEIGDYLRAEAEEKLGVKVYPGFSIGWVKVSSNDKPIVEPADIKNLKIRTTSSDMYMEFVRAAGASPTPVNYGELFTALQQGTVDGMMTTTSLYESDRFYEVQKYMGAIDPFTIFHIPLVSQKWFGDLPDDLKPIFEECMAEYIEKMRELEEEKERTAKEKMVEFGMDLVEYTPEQKQEWIDIGLQVSDDMGHIAGEEFVQRVKDYLAQ